MTDQKLVQTLLEEVSSGAEQQQDLERRIMMAIERRRRRVARMRLLVAVVWGALVLTIVAGGWLEASGYDLIASSLAIVARAVFLLALVFTASWYVRSVSLRFDSIQQALAAVQDRLDALNGAKAGD